MSQPVSLGLQLWSDIDSVDLCLVLDTQKPQRVPTVVWLHRIVFQVNSTYASRLSTAGTVAFHWTVCSIPSALAVIRFMYLKEWTWPTVLRQQRCLFEDACRLGCFALVRQLQPLVPVTWCTTLLQQASQQPTEFQPASLPSLSKFYHERGRTLTHSSATAPAIAPAIAPATAPSAAPATAPAIAPAAAPSAAPAAALHNATTVSVTSSIAETSSIPSPVLRPQQNRRSSKRVVSPSSPPPSPPKRRLRYCGTRFWSKHTRRRTYGIRMASQRI